jgi:hypothetical protein
MNSFLRPRYGSLKLNCEFTRQVRTLWANIESPGRSAPAAPRDFSPGTYGGGAEVPVKEKRPLAA